MTADLGCIEIAFALAANGPLVERHVAECASCRGTAAVLTVVRHATEASVPEVWPRLRRRLASANAARVHLRVPIPGWRAAAAVAAIVTATALAPEPGRLLAVMLGTL